MLFFFCILTTNAQKITIVFGDLSLLKGQTKIYIEYKYDSMIVGEKTETKYITKKVIDYNYEEIGKGDKWLEKWKSDRKNFFQPEFEEKLNLYLSPLKINISPFNVNAPFTLILHTDYTDPGFNAGVSQAPGVINVTVTFVETKNKNKELIKIKISQASSHFAGGKPYKTTDRLKEAYGNCGSKLGKFLKKKAFK